MSRDGLQEEVNILTKKVQIVLDSQGSWSKLTLAGIGYEVLQSIAALAAFCGDNPAPQRWNMNISYATTHLNCPKHTWTL